MPFEDRKRRRQRRKDRILRCRFIQVDIVPAELAMPADAVFAAEAARQKLRTKTDAQHGAVVAFENADQLQQCREPR